MKAIFTKFHGPTNTRGARISASDSDGNKVVISYPHELSGEACHRLAADTLCKKMNWTGRLASGGHNKGYVFVWSDPDAALLAAAKDALESLKRLPDTDGAYRVSCISQLETAIRNAKAR